MPSFFVKPVSPFSEPAFLKLINQDDENDIPFTEDDIQYNDNDIRYIQDEHQESDFKLIEQKSFSFPKI